MPFPRTVLVALIVTTVAAASQTVSFPTEDGGRVCADLYGTSTRAVVLAHGGRFTKESWHEQADVLAVNGFQVLAIDFRGFGCSSGPGEKDFDHAPFENDVLAAVRYLKTGGAKTVSVVGGSFGAAAAGDASIKSASSDIDRIVFLGGAPNLSAEKLKSRSLFIVARNDANDAGPRLPTIRAQYERAPQPKHLLWMVRPTPSFFFRPSRAIALCVRFFSSSRRLKGKGTGRHPGVIDTDSGRN